MLFCLPIVYTCLHIKVLQGHSWAIVTNIYIAFKTKIFILYMAFYRKEFVLLWSISSILLSSSSIHHQYHYLYLIIYNHFTCIYMYMHVHASVYICLICVWICICVCVYIYIHIYVFKYIFLIHTLKFICFVHVKVLEDSQVRKIYPQIRSKIEHDKSRTRTKITRRNNTLNLFKPFNFGTTWFWSLSIYEIIIKFGLHCSSFRTKSWEQIHENNSWEKEIVPIFLCRFKESSLVDITEIISLQFHFKYRMHNKMKQDFWEF